MFSLSKFIALAIVLAISLNIDQDYLFATTVLGASLAHFWIAAIYDWKYLSRHWAEQRSPITLGASTIGGLFMGLWNHPILNALFFGFHAAFSESGAGLTPYQKKFPQLLFISQIAFEGMLIALMFFRSYLILSHLAIVIPIVAISLVTYGYILVDLKTHLSSERLWNIIGLHGATAVMVILTL